MWSLWDKAKLNSCVSSTERNYIILYSWGYIDNCSHDFRWRSHSNNGGCIHTNKHNKNRIPIFQKSNIFFSDCATQPHQSWHILEIIVLFLIDLKGDGIEYLRRACENVNITTSKVEVVLLNERHKIRSWSLRSGLPLLCSTNYWPSLRYNSGGYTSC